MCFFDHYIHKSLPKNLKSKNCPKLWDFWQNLRFGANFEILLEIWVEPWVDTTLESTGVDSTHSAIDSCRGVGTIYVQFFWNWPSSHGERVSQSTWFFDENRPEIVIYLLYPSLKKTCLYEWVYS